MAAKKKLNEAEILTKVQAKVKNCVSWYDSRVSKEREKVMRYYDGKYPLRQNEGKSSYVSSDVYDAVETMKAQILEVFAGGHSIAKFKPRDQDDVRQSRIETKYVNHVIFEQNNGYQVLHDAIHDGLTARNGVAMIVWEERYTYDEETFENMPYEEVLALASQDEISDLDAEYDVDAEEGAPTYSGEFRRKYDHCKVKISPLAPEEFFVEQARKKREDGVRGHRTSTTRAELVADGYDKKKIEKIHWDDDTAMSPEAQVRDEETGNGVNNNDAVQDELQRVTLYQAYIDLALKDDGTACLYKVIYAGSVLLDIEECDEDCYVDWAPLRRPHTYWGNNFGNRVIATQNARTVLTRAILDHTAVTTNPRWQVVQGGLLNPREMLDNRQGGLVNTTRPDAVLPLPVANLNPFVFETLGMLKDNKEESTGLSALSQGLNKDAISSQNAEGLIDKLVSLSQIRQKIIARNFANDFFVQMYLKVWRCAMKHDKKKRIMEIAGDYVEVDPQSWVDKRDVSVALELGYGEQERAAAKKVQLYTALSKDPGAREFVTSKHRHKLLIDATQEGGIDNYADYIGPPGSNQPPPPDPIEMGKVEAMKMTAEAALITAKAAADKVGATDKKDTAKSQTDAAKLAVQAEKNARDAERQDLDTVNRVDVAQQELELAKKVVPENQRGIFSATI